MAGRNCDDGEDGLISAYAIRVLVCLSIMPCAMTAVANKRIRH